MYRKCFFKSKGGLSRKFVASGLSAVFSSGMFGSYAGAMEQPEQGIEYFFNMDTETELDKVLGEDSIKEDEYAEEVFRFFIHYPSYLLKSGGVLFEDVDKNDIELLKDKGFLTRVFAYLLLFKIYDGIKDFSINVLLEEFKSNKSTDYFFDVFKNLNVNIRTNLLNKIKNGWGKNLLKKVKIDEHGLDKNIKNKRIVVSVVIILLAIIVTTITLALKGKSNTGVPNNNKDDKKVNPSIEPEKDKDDEKMNPSTDPESDDENLEQKKQEQGSQEQKSSIGLEILKGAGATVTAGTLAGSGAYLVNKVSKSGKPSEVKNSSNVDDKYMYLDSDGNKVTKTEERKKDNYDADDENADNSGTKQLLEDKNAEKIEEEQEEILESSALSDDTEATSDEEKNKD